jgi:hypothetical protein
LKRKPEQTKTIRSGKGRHGGAGRGQGRKKILTVLGYMDAIDVGSTCEDLWRRLSERKARTEFREQQHVKRIRQEQALIISFRRSSPEIREPIREFVSEEIDEILDDARHDAGVPTPKFKRLVNIPLKRPKGKREWVKRVVARLARRAYRIAISPRRVEDRWKEYRKSERELAAAGVSTVTEEPAPKAAAELLAPASEQAPELEPAGPTPPPALLTHRKPLTAAERQERIRQRREAKFLT